MKQVEKSKNSKPRPIFVLLAAIAVLFSLFLLGLVALAGWQLTQPYGAESAGQRTGKTLVTVNEGDSSSKIASNLFQQKLIANPWLLEIMLNLGPARGRIKPGPYLIQPGTNMYQLATMLSRGQIAIIKLTFPEGLTIEELANRWQAAGLGSRQDFVSATRQAYNFNFLSGTVPAGNLEGYLFPATYKVIYGTPAAGLVQQMLQAFSDQAWSVLQGSRPQNLSPNQILTLASIIEKEANTSQDRKMVAGVFYNRLKVGMKLQSDVTVNYATGKKTTSPGDLRVNSPYNTYLAPGLPPAPINNPSLDAIEAAMNPAQSDYLFFLADQQGNIRFATTNAQHQANIEKYLNN
ncbi:endolytic transglycosylase MltG [Candidatus Saccharibacteria bacterium]|nr:endolytic transglycosylase MltG [Candidatus Saccharibacteria bacterium]